MSSKEERLEELKRKLKKDPEVFKGFVAGAEARSKGFVHWSKASTDARNNLKGMEDQVFFDKPDPIKKRDPLARVESLTRRLLDHMEESIKVYGHPEVPQDILDEIRREYALNGRIKDAADVTAENLKALAAGMLQDAENRSK